eukprot:TCONS_00034803-protein
MHNLTGSRQVIDFLNKLDYCITYNDVCDIETALAEAAQVEAQSATVLRYHPATLVKLFSHFWIDDFDIKVDKEVGERSIHTTHMMYLTKVDHLKKKFRNSDYVSKKKFSKIHLWCKFEDNWINHS